jgi:uncharacterized repeat protein (TIGR02543 family)
MKRSSMAFFIFFLINLAFQIWVPLSSGNDLIIKVDASSHQKFGLYYPVTYKFSLPPGSTGLAAQYKYSLETAWNTLPEKRSGDIFNGVDVVRFDYGRGWAYISVSFDRASDYIYLRVLDAAGQPVSITFDSIPKYYDERKAAVVITLDDWSDYGNDGFVRATDYLASYGLYFTVGIMTAGAPWNSVQQKIDQHGEYMEVASHSMNHPEDAAGYAIAGFQTEVIGSRDAIRNNLNFKAKPYVPVYLEPGGYSDATLVSWVSAGDYLLTRSSDDNFNSGSSFVAWDSTQLRYGRGAVAFTDSAQTWDANLLAKSNGLFDQAMANGGIYSLTNHPWSGFWTDGSYLLQHVEYIKGRSDVWYAPYGHLYLYHFLQEMRGNLTIQSVDGTPTAPVADFTASPRTGRGPLSVNFSDRSTGSITSRLWDFGDATTSDQQNPVHVYNQAGSYTVQLTVSGPGGTNIRSKADYVVVSQSAPAANFSATPRTGTPPLTVNFSDSSTGSVTGWLWDFGDTTTSKDQSPVHIYTRAGSYTVRLTVSGPRGTNSRSRSGYIVVNPAPLVANFTATTGTAPLTVSFSDSSTGSIIGWLWDFGDATTSNKQNPVHVYNSAGSYTVRLTVSGPGRTNPTATATQNIKVDSAVSTYLLSFAAGANGSLSGSLSQLVKYSGSATPVRALPAAGYHFVNWTGDNGFVTTTANPLTVVNVTAAQHITANFASDNGYTLAYTAEANGVINGAATQTVNSGGSGTQVTAQANPGYCFVSWSDGLTSASRTDLNVTANIAVSARFVMKDGIILPAQGKTVPDLTDALRALRMAVGLVTPTASDLIHGDVAPLGVNSKPKGDGVIDILDVIGILRMIVGMT